MKHRYMRMTAPDIDFHYRVLVWSEDSFYFQYDLDHPSYDTDPSLKDRKEACEESIRYEKFMQVRDSSSFCVTL